MVELDDGRTLVASDSASTYADGYRIAEPAGKWWAYPSCVIGISGSGLHLSRVHVKLEQLHRDWKGKGLVEPMHIQDIVLQVQDEMRTNEGVESLEVDLLYSGAPDGLYRIGGDGDVCGPHRVFATVGSGAELLDGILTFALKPRRCPSRRHRSRRAPRVAHFFLPEPPRRTPDAPPSSGVARLGKRVSLAITRWYIVGALCLVSESIHRRACLNASTPWTSLPGKNGPSRMK